MIADDNYAIRTAMRKLAQDKAQAAAEAERRAEIDNNPITLPEPKPLFDDLGPPYRGGCVSEKGIRGFFLTADGKPDSNFDQDAWDEWDDATLDSGVTDKTARMFMWGKIDT